MLPLRLAVAAVTATGLTLGAVAIGPGRDRLPQPPSVASAAGGTTVAKLAEMPLAFEANAGRIDRRVDYIARGAGWSLFLSPREAVVSVSGKDGSDVVRTRLVGAAAPPAEASGRLPGVINSLHGDDRSKWRTGIRSFERVRYPSVYPGTDLVYYGKQGQLEYDFVLAPGADPSRIAFDVSGARSVHIDRRGDLVMSTDAGPVRHHKPIAYQRIHGERRAVAAHFVLEGERVRIQVGEYDRSRRLVIDPILGYAFQTGGDDYDAGWAIDVDAAGNAYVGATTNSTTFPGVGAPNGSSDAIVMKLSPSGTPLYTTYVGGSGGEDLHGLTVNADGSAYFVGQTTSTDFPHERAPETILQGSSDAYVARLNTTGDDILWATYLGGDGAEQGEDLALDSNGDVHVVGQTGSTNFFTSTFRYQTDQASTDGFVTRIDDSLPTVAREYSTYLGSNAADSLNGVDVSASNQTYVVGTAVGDGYPAKSAPVAGQTRAGESDVAYSRLDTTPPAGATTAETQANSLEFSRYIGGALSDTAEAISLAHSPGGAAYIVGQTKSTDLPQAINVSPFTHRPTGTLSDYDGFVMETGGVSLNQTAYLGGDNIEYATDVAALTSATGSPMAYVVGTSRSANFPTSNALRAGNDGEYQMFALKWYPVASGPELIWSTHLGGPADEDFGEGIAVDAQGRAYVTGRSGADFLEPPGEFADGAFDLGVARIDSRAPSITSGPADGSTITTTTAQFGLQGDTSQTLRCNALDSTNHISSTPSRTTCNVLKTYNGLADGTHVFEVVGQDEASHTSDPALARRTFKVDTTVPPPFDMIEPAEGATTGTRPTVSWQESADAVSAVSYRLLVDGQDVQAVESSACTGGTCSAQIATPLVTGNHSLRVRAVDAVGHSTDSASERSIVVKDPPTARMTINPNPSLAGRTVTFDGAASADPTHTIVKYEWDLDGDGSFERDTSNSAVTTQSYSSAKTITVSLRVTDSQGSPATTSQILRITAPGAAGTLLGVTINKGAQYTRTPNVTVSAVFPAGTTSMIISNDGGFLAGGTFGPQSETKWKLDSSGPERLPKTIYVRFFTGPFPSETFQDDIILDETPPIVQQATLAGSASASANQLATASAKRRLKRWKLRIRARDSNSGVARVQATANKRKPGKLLRYKRRLTVKAATKPKWVRARDRAGNYSRWRKIR